VPRVSIGLPVYNGEAYLDLALRSLLAQTFGDFEILISDNASSDRTAEICQEYARRDSRIRYVRAAENLGAARNYNRVFEMSSGAYFKWAAHDDVCHPEFIASCVRELDENQSAVLAYPRTAIIDAAGNYVERYEVQLRTDSPACYERFHALTRGHQCYEVFGVIRHAALRAVAPLGAHFGADAVLLARLALMGRFIEIPHCFFQRRAHQAASESLRSDLNSYAKWWSGPGGNGLTLPYWRLGLEFAKAVRRAAIGTSAKARCYVSVGGWYRRRLRFLSRDLVRAARQLVAKAAYVRRTRDSRRGNP